jgi:hypothetical protein
VEYWTAGATRLIVSRDRLNEICAILAANFRITGNPKVGPVYDFAIEIRG